jgi:hypothetical protein
MQPVTPPSIYVNGTLVPNIEVQNGPLSFTGNRDSFVGNGESVAKFQQPLTITFSADPGAVIRYEFTNDVSGVNLGSPVYNPNNPPVVYNGANGFDGSALNIVAIAYLNGDYSTTSQADVRIIGNLYGQVSPG